jgi:hypothetical protein
MKTSSLSHHEKSIAGHVFAGRLPTEQRISSIFQTTTTQSRALLRAVMSKFQYELQEAIHDTLREELDSAQSDPNADGYLITVDSENVIEALNRQIASIDGTLPQIIKARHTVSTYEIAGSSYKKLSRPPSMTNPVSSDLLSAASLLATVLSLLYSTWYGEIKDARNSKIPLHDRGPVIDVAHTALWSRAVPLLAASALLAGALAPPSLQILLNTWHVWLTASSNYHYDPVEACFLGVFVVTIVLAVLTASATLSLVRLLQKLRSPLKAHVDN